MKGKAVGCSKAGQCLTAVKLANVRVLPFHMRAGWWDFTMLL